MIYKLYGVSAVCNYGLVLRMKFQVVGKSTEKLQLLETLNVVTCPLLAVNQADQLELSDGITQLLRGGRVRGKHCAFGPVIYLFDLRLD